MDLATLKSSFDAEKSFLFSDLSFLFDAYKFCVRYSSLIEEYTLKTVSRKNYNFALAACGSFCRRELSPKSDIDLIFIIDKEENFSDDIKECIANLWTVGIEASHTLRTFEDIDLFFESDIQSFTQLFETRFLYGNYELFLRWKSKLSEKIDTSSIVDVFNKFYQDIKSRHKKYGNSPKTLEPNVKQSAGGLRDLQSVEWIYSIRNKLNIADETELTQTEKFFLLLGEKEKFSIKEINRAYEAYKFILGIRNLLHALNNRKADRLDYENQEKIAEVIGKTYGYNSIQDLMKKYFECSNVLHRFSRTILRKFDEELNDPIDDLLIIKLDDDFAIKDKVISYISNEPLTLSDIIRAFYYRGLHSKRFDERLRSLIIDQIQEYEGVGLVKSKSSVFFREILKLEKNVGETLTAMNELGVLQAAIPEFKDMVGFFQKGVYHWYTADDHTLIAIKNLEKLSDQDTKLAKLFKGLKEKELLYLAVLFHDIGKPIILSGHEIIGAEIAANVMTRMGYNEREVKLVAFLVRNHLLMEQTAFRRNLNDPETLNSFAENFENEKQLEMLYLLTYADLSAVNPMVWTNWKNQLLEELYGKTKEMILKKIKGEEILIAKRLEINEELLKEIGQEFANHSLLIDDDNYFSAYTKEEIIEHIDTINKNLPLSVIFKEDEHFTNVTIITKDQKGLLAKLCGVFSINDIDIHDAKIFTRKDGIVIDTFNTLDFRTKEKLDLQKREKVKKDIAKVLEGELSLAVEFKNMKSRWKWIEKKIFNKEGRVKVSFEETEKYTIIEVFSPDRLGLLYTIAKTFEELDISIYFAKIATRGDEIVDIFYALDQNNRKINPLNYDIIRYQLKTSICELL